MHEQPTLPFLESQSSSRPPDFIPVYTPDIGRREQELVNDAVSSGWISSLGKYVSQFEQDFAAFIWRCMRWALAPVTRSLCRR
jgi:dTDP-4-amino-4,6-dideoxygalactose transaminase